MLAGTAVGPGARLGVFWEAYGVSPGDTVQVSLRVTGARLPGLLRRIGAAIGIGQPAPGTVTVGWQEPRADRGGSSSVIAGVPVQSRSVVLDVSSLPPGPYVLNLQVARRGAAPASATRTISVVAR
jgi:hypothetical protein